MILTIVFFILLLGALILVHEFGHFFAARKFGVKVDEFGFGFSGKEFGLNFPPKLFTFRRKGVLYSVNPLPLGGFVKIFGEQGEAEKDPESFISRPIWQRTLIIVAGVVMNIVLAWLLFSLGHGFGLPTAVDESDQVRGAKVTVVGVQPNSPAEVAGLRFGDAIEEIKDQKPVPSRVEGSKIKIDDVEQVQQFIDKNRGEEVFITISRGKDVIDIRVVPRQEPPPGEGPLGIAMARIGVVRSPWWRALWDGAKTTLNAIVAIISALGHIFRDIAVKGEVSSDISGPVGIFVFADQTSRLGLSYLIELAGILSVNLALINILPIPALDGGRVLFLLIERVRGVRVDQRLENIIHTLGFLALMAIMAAITYRDIVRFF